VKAVDVRCRSALGAGSLRGGNFTDANGSSQMKQNSIFQLQENGMCKVHHARCPSRLKCESILNARTRCNPDFVFEEKLRTEQHHFA
jgi:hypothetical protein